MRFDGVGTGSVKPGSPLPAEVPAPALPAPRLSVSSAMRRHWLTASLPLVVLVGVAVAAGLARPPTYTADARLAVGRLEGSTPAGLVGFSQVTATLAETYSRSLGSRDVLLPAAHELGMRPERVLASASAAPIPESPVLRVRGEAASARDAARIANAVSRALVRRARRLAEPAAAYRTLRRRYLRTVRKLVGSRPTLKRRTRKFERNPTRVNERRLAEVKTAVDTAGLRLRALQRSYDARQRGTEASALLSVIGPARGARDDRNSVLQLLVFAAVVAGGTIGAGLALLRANRKLRASKSGHSA
jgi:uncharacterized protein involved in exopolysaccharide biosynthesis